MSTDIVNQVAYLRTSREFPAEIKQLSIEVFKSYSDIANKVNSRIIGIFSVNRPSLTGESWFLTSKRQQTFRQVYPFTATAGVVAPIAHDIKFPDIAGFTQIYGTFTDGTNWYPLPYVSTTGAVASQVSLFVDPININITGGGGGSQPTIDSGFVVLQWLAEP